MQYCRIIISGSCRCEEKFGACVSQGGQGIGDLPAVLFFRTHHVSPLRLGSSSRPRRHVCVDRTLKSISRKRSLHRKRHHGARGNDAARYGESLWVGAQSVFLCPQVWFLVSDSYVSIISKNTLKVLSLLNRSPCWLVRGRPHDHASLLAVPNEPGRMAHDLPSYDARSHGTHAYPGNVARLASLSVWKYRRSKVWAGVAACVCVARFTSHCRAFPFWGDRWFFFHAWSCTGFC